MAEACQDCSLHDPEWGHVIKKLGANHACKCYRGALEQLDGKNAVRVGSAWIGVSLPCHQLQDRHLQVCPSIWPLGH